MLSILKSIFLCVSFNYTSINGTIQPTIQPTIPPTSFLMIPMIIQPSYLPSLPPTSLPSLPPTSLPSLPPTSLPTINLNKNAKQVSKKSNNLPKIMTNSSNSIFDYLQKYIDDYIVKYIFSDDYNIDVSEGTYRDIKIRKKN